MDEEIRLTEGEKETQPSTLGKIFVIVKRSILLILLIVALGIGAGILIAELQQPVYTSTNTVTFTASSTSNDKVSITSNMDFMNLNYRSVIDFCRSDVVADRADYYYGRLLKERQTNAKLSVDEYLKALEIYEDVAIIKETDESYTYENYFADKTLKSKGYVEAYEDDSHLEEYVNALLSDSNLSVSYGVFRYFLTQKRTNNALTLTEYLAGFTTLDGTHYDATKVEKREYIDAKLISSYSTATTTGANSYINYFTITYKDYDKTAAVEKLSIIDFAADVEINSGYVNGDTKEEYFNGITIAIKASENPGYATDTSKLRIILIAAFVGLVLAGAVVYIRYLFDTTVKDKNDLENLTGTKVIAYIVDREAK